MKYHSLTNKPEKKAVPSGNPIYEYEYLDQNDGKVKKNKVNTQEKIQSYYNVTDYKRKILNGEVIVDGNVDIVARDYTNFPNSKAAILDFINKAARLGETGAANLVKEILGSTEETQEIGSEVNEANVQNTEQVGEVEPTS